MENILIEKLKVPTKNLRNIPKDEDDKSWGKIHGIGQSMKSVGLLYPLRVCQNVDGTYDIQDGIRRFCAAKIIGWKDVPCIIVDRNDNFLATSVIANEQKQSTKRSDVARIILDYHYNQHKSLDEISDIFGFSVPEIVKYLRLTVIGDENLKLLDSKELSLSNAVLLAKYKSRFDSDEFDTLLEKAKVEKAEVFEKTVQLVLDAKKMEQKSVKDIADTVFVPVPHFSRERLSAEFEKMHFQSQADEIDTVEDMAIWTFLRFIYQISDEDNEKNQALFDADKAEKLKAKAEKEKAKAEKAEKSEKK